MENPYIMLPLSKFDVDALLHLFADIKSNIQNGYYRDDPQVTMILNDFLDRKMNDIYKEIKTRGYVGDIISEIEKSMRKMQ